MRIVLIGETPLVFNLDDIRQLRQHGIVGVLSGTLPSLSQQNVFLSVPLRLMMEELLWLLWDSPLDVNVVGGGLPHFSKDVKSGQIHGQQSALRVQESFEQQRLQRWENHVRKLRLIGVEPQPGDSNLLEGSLFMQTHDSRKDDVKSEHTSSELNPTADQIRHYKLYRKLRQMGFTVHPGGRFGGKYVVYPGDPLRFHSHVVISEPLEDDEPLDFLQMVAGARLATTVKKSYVASCVEAKGEEEARFYSFEWAGFG
ncbi:hypothetical protein ZYGR_0AD01900 [Zygosaccharomyces rouxii]|uniref:tRNA-splicing endonuclease subunit Sen34 n=2 Tax=Zygosaccharomyces rouxii TaxID=4956 RepID=C5E074_ZYGRC|nr:uncharacterized protein ZYRO0G10340g [Zygosaccharomyces rouxii]KAH9202503.1 tRNA intron endonuclease [Zygosaccharomyces rouxii]GAV51007.1 hypothetical protein ZYGR_0AD01900 [Zygosaccharomyces rouxii]CAR29508.1 ZYRO0G10340p [Zygosaccharomyces rouxii]